MGRNTGPLGASLRGLDAFGKTLDDVKVKTGTGGLCASQHSLPRLHLGLQLIQWYSK
jgi:hypothetical protein